MGRGESMMLSADLYVLKHKDLDVAMVQVDRSTGRMEYVLDMRE